MCMCFIFDRDSRVDFRVISYVDLYVLCLNGFEDL